MGLRRGVPGASAVRLALSATVLLGAVDSGEVEAYRFYPVGDADPIATAAEAVRWDTQDFPLRFHLQDNIPDYLEEPEWRDMARDGLREWSAIPTADIRLSLEPGAVEGDGADGGDGNFTIGWISFEDGAGSFSGRAYKWSWVATGRYAHCDIEMNADRFREWLDEGIEPEWVTSQMRDTLVHEVGHCLGLDHTEPHPIPGWGVYWEEPAPIPPGFLPETVMSYGFGSVAEVTDDEETAVSLLYPQAGFAASRGAVSGRLVGDAGVVPFAYVQAVYPGWSPRMGPGAFADEAGYFHLEGLRPGTVLLWVHPILVHGSNAHGKLLAMAFEGGGLDVLDQWQWVQVTRGETVGAPDILLAAGRLP